ncbi:MAG: phosphoglycerate mutase (2,3-diphosphoglycerate-independent) [Flavobacteriaceae bacterium]|nr:phosphoglycerate mutase (2,3-diphosphoglycerate-independent) [Flavobacteriaceae bacterium]
MSKKVILMILDGWGIAKDPKVSAIDKAKTPFIDSLYNNYASAKLTTFGESVGLPSGQMGNSEVGHINLGAGRIVYQELTKINRDIQQKTFQNQHILKTSLENVKQKNKKLHLLGLLSDGGVHSHIDHLEGIIDACNEKKIDNIYIHVFTDGRDVDPKSGLKFIQELNNKIINSEIKIATVIGRYFSMDRDNRWERTKKSYDLLTKGIGEKSQNILESIQSSYNRGVTDEFIEPIVKVDNLGNPIGNIEEGDYVIFFNFRTDRGRQLTKVLTQENFSDLKMKKLNLNFLTMTNYDESFKGIETIYDSGNITDTLGEVIANSNKTQIRIAETEKYPHVTFFFNGGREKPFKNESRILCPSPKVPTYDIKPEMSAYKVKDSIIEEIKKNSTDFICLNFANPDMVGHTGNLEAAIKACETVDKCSSEIIDCALEKEFSIIVIADHGNCDKMKNSDGSPHTAHTKNMVPIIIVDHKIKKVSDGILADIAPTVLDLMNIKKPKLMTGKSLIN